MAQPSGPAVGHLYAHVPFCAQKCHYCAFYSRPPEGDLIQRYVHALLQELASIAPDLRPQTIFFGGGTPSLLNLRQWEEIFAAMDRLHLGSTSDHHSPTEWTVECNPATISLDKATLLRDNGVNRISMGVQSLDEGLLDRLGRVHSRDMVFRSYDLLRQAGFENINLDLMFGIPGQTMEIWRRTLRETIALDPEHVSCYEVIYEEDTALFEQLKAGEFAVDPDLNSAMFEALVDEAGQHQFHQYEVANFARHRPRTTTNQSLPSAASPPAHWTQFLPSQACRHNVNYWRGGSFHGIGPSATGYVRGRRTKNWPNTTLYCEKIEQGQPAAQFAEELPPLARAGETAAFGLRMNAGWAFDHFRDVTGFDLRQEWSQEIEHATAAGCGECDAMGFRLTPRGLRLADAIGADFLRSEPSTQSPQVARTDRP